MTNSSACGCGHSASVDTCAPAGQGQQGCGCGQHDKAEGQGCKCSKLMPFRRWHSAMGLVFGLFVVMHLGVLATAVSPSRFDQNAAAMHTLADGVPLVKWLGVIAPMLVIAASGTYLLWKHGMRYEVKKCHRGGKARFFLQRVAGVVVLGFLVVHLADITAGLDGWGAGVPYDFRRIQEVIGKGPRSVGIQGLYLAGIMAMSYHFANGLWTGAIAWKLADDSRRRGTWGWCCMAIGGLIAGVGVIAWVAFAMK